MRAASIVTTALAGVLLAGPLSAQDPCAALAYVRMDEGAGAYKAEWDESAFWKRLQQTSPDFGDVIARSTPLARSALLGRYLWVSEGGVDPFFTSASPMRTGFETRMYGLIKQHVMSGGGLLGPAQTMRFAMQAVADGSGGRANVQLALLTTHNLVRVLARPEQWAPGYDPNDIMKPIFEDLSGKPAVGGQSLRTFLKEKHRMGGNPNDPNAIGYSLFESGSNVQVFGTMGSVGSAEAGNRGLANGGSHYYFWLGAVGQAIAGDLVAAGLKSEKDVKAAIGAASGSVGAIQARNGQGGRALARCLESVIQNGGAVGPPPPPAPGSVGGLFASLEKVEKARGECEIEDALVAARSVDQTYAQEPAWVDWFGANMAKLEAQAAAQKQAREILKKGQDAIRAKDLTGAIDSLESAQYVTDLPDCMKPKIQALLADLSKHREFIRLTREVARASNDECDFKKAAQFVGDITRLTPREDFITDWLSREVPKLNDLQQREKEALELVSQADAAAAATPPEVDKAVKLLGDARDKAPSCLKDRLQLDKRIADARPPIESSIVLLIDTSGSMSSNDKIGQAKRAAQAAVRKASRTTEMAVMQFDGGCGAGSARVVHEFSTDANSLMRSIDPLQPGGGTPMYIATGVATEYAKTKGRGKSRVVVLMSDGGDSCRDQIANASAAIRTSNIPVNAIGFDVGNNQQAQGDLGNIATITNGRSLSASATDPREIIRAFDMALLPNLLKSADAGGAAAAGAGGAAGAPVGAYFSKAQSLVAQQDLGGALFQFQQAYKVAPTSPAVNFNLSLLHEANDQLIPAMDHAKKYLSLAPSAADRADVEGRIANLADELKRNPRVQIDTASCRDVYDWAQVAQDAAKRTRDTARKQQMLEILIAAQKGECDKARAAAADYKNRYR